MVSVKISQSQEYSLIPRVCLTSMDSMHGSATRTFLRTFVASIATWNDSPEKRPARRR